MNESNAIIFSVLIFVSIILVFFSFYSIHREAYAIDTTHAENLKVIRSILFITTSLQLLCYIGYWFKIYVIYELCWIIWLILSTLSIVLLGIRFGESYIMLDSKLFIKYYNKIPNKYKYLIYAFWLIGCCVDILGTIFGFFMSNVLAQSICYSVWEILCSISICFLIHILKSVRDKFYDINIAKIRKKQKIKKKKKKRKIKKRDKEIDDDENKQEHVQEEYTIKSIKSYGSLKCGDGYIVDNDKSCSKLSKTSTKTHSIIFTYSGSLGSMDPTNTNESKIISNQTNRMNLEIKRMRNLIYGLGLIIIVFMVNAFFNGFHTLFSFKQYVYNDKYSIYMTTPTWVIAFVFFPEWTVINIFIMMFSWIPTYQLTDDYHCFKICLDTYKKICT